MWLGCWDLEISFFGVRNHWDFLAQSSLVFSENGPKSENIQGAAILWAKMSC